LIAWAGTKRVKAAAGPDRERAGRLPWANHPIVHGTGLATFVTLVPERSVILIADDREEDILLIRKAFEKAGISNPVYCVTEGEAAINYLAGHGKYSNRAEYPLPTLLLLDLKMPGTDGFDVLRWLQATPSLKSLRVIVLTSSADIRDVNLAYKLGANSFLVKPMDFENTVELARIVQRYWLQLDKAPKISRPSDVEKPR